MFDGNWTAVLNSEETKLTNTLFDNSYLGFIGDIATRDSNGNLNVFTSKKAASTSKNGVIINSKISGWPPEQLSAKLDSSGEYHLKLEEKSQTVIEDAFKRIYGNAVPAMKVFEMTLTEHTDTVALKKLGDTPLTVTVPLPTEITGNTVHVVVLDEDGQLEKLSSKLEEKNGKTYVKFSTVYLSDFAIYAMGENGTVQIANGQVTTTVSGKKDYSPNTGDNSIHPKWFIAIGLSALAIGLMTAKPKKRRKIS